MVPAVLQVTLKDPGTDAALQATIEADDRGINIGFAEYGDYSSAAGFGRPVFIEFYEGRLTIHVWTDILQQDPTHVLHMENARQDRRIRRSARCQIFDDDDGYELDVCPVCCLVITRQQEPDTALIEIDGEPALVHNRCIGMVLFSLPT